MSRVQFPTFSPRTFSIKQPVGLQFTLSPINFQNRRVASLFQSNTGHFSTIPFAISQRSGLLTIRSRVQFPAFSPWTFSIKQPVQFILYLINVPNSRVTALFQSKAGYFSTIHFAINQRSRLLTIRFRVQFSAFSPRKFLYVDYVWNNSYLPHDYNWVTS
jgi:hypothetical protein